MKQIDFIVGLIGIKNINEIKKKGANKIPLVSIMVNRTIIPLLYDLHWVIY